MITCGFFTTTHIRITHITGFALTDHSTQRQCVHYRANSICATWLRHRAWILTFAIEAGQLAGTVRVHGTLWCDLGFFEHTANQRIATVARWAATLCAMIVDTTLSADTAIAWIFTTFILAGQIEGALVVACTFGSFTAQQWIAAITVGAMTACLVIVVGTADGIRATLRVWARIGTLFIDASLGGGAFFI